MIINNSSNSTVIKAWQTFLNSQGINVGTPDGVWGPHTESGSKAFQTANNLSADGIIGPATIKEAEAKGFVVPQPEQFAPATYLNAVFDISHHNASVDFAKAKADGMLGVFHKATQSTTLIDDKYAERKIAAKNAGLLWGAYHFASGGDVDGQVDFFLKTAQPDGNTLLVLDFERDTTKGQTTMTLQEAKEFVTQVKDKTGKFPGLYGGSLLRELLRTAADPVLSQCWLWNAYYGSTFRLPQGWDYPTLWQYTDGVHGPGALPIDGIGNCDRDLYHGTAAELQVFWTANMV